MGPTWGLQDPGGPYVGHVNVAIWDNYHFLYIVYVKLKSCCEKAWFNQLYRYDPIKCYVELPCMSWGCLCLFWNYNCSAHPDPAGTVNEVEPNNIFGNNCSSIKWFWNSCERSPTGRWIQIPAIEVTWEYCSWMVFIRFSCCLRCRNHLQWICCKDTVASILINGNYPHIWKLPCHWLRGLSHMV